MPRRGTRSDSLGDCTDTTSKATECHIKDKSLWICFLKDDILKEYANCDNNPAFYKIRHPKTEQGTMFLFTNGDQELYEVNVYNEEYRSWFIDNTVQKDGSLLLTVPVDPVFLTIPYLQKVQQKFMTLDQILCDEDFPDCSRLSSTSGISELHQVTDIKESEDFKAYRYNEEKTLSWLQCKTDRLADNLSDREFCVSGAQTSAYVRSKRAMTASRDDFVRYAYGMVSDYLPIQLSNKLREHMKIPVAVVKKENEPPLKKAKTGDVTPTEDYSQQETNTQSNKGTKLTMGQKKLSKVDKSGMKSLASFFSPKAKT